MNKHIEAMQAALEALMSVRVQNMGSLIWPAICKLRAALAEPQPLANTMAEQFLFMVAQIWVDNPDASIRETLDVLNAQFPKEPQPEPLPPQIPNEFGHLLTQSALWKMYASDEPQPEPVAADIGKSLRFATHGAPVYAAPQRNQDFYAWYATQSKYVKPTDIVPWMHEAWKAALTQQPLTHEQIDAIPFTGFDPNRGHSETEALRLFARAIEEAHGIEGKT